MLCYLICFLTLLLWKKLALEKYFIKRKTQRNVKIAISREFRKREQPLSVTQACFVEVKITALGTGSWGYTVMVKGLPIMCELLNSSTSSTTRKEESHLEYDIQLNYSVIIWSLLTSGISHQPGAHLHCLTPGHKLQPVVWVPLACFSKKKTEFYDFRGSQVLVCSFDLSQEPPFPFPFPKEVIGDNIITKKSHGLRQDCKRKEPFSS